MENSQGYITPSESRPTQHSLAQTYTAMPSHAQPYTAMHSLEPQITFYVEYFGM